MAETNTPSSSRVGTIIRYYLNGWRFGTLEAIEGALAVIKPAGNKKSVHLPLEDVDFEELK